MLKTPIIQFVEKVFGYDLEALDRKIVATTDRTLWYRVRHSDKALFTPSTSVLKVNSMELDKFIGAVESFCKFPLDDPRFNWDEDSIHKEYFSGESVSFGLNKLLAYFDAFSRDGNDYCVSCDIETHHAGWENNHLLSIGFAITDNDVLAFSEISEEDYPLLEKVLNYPNVRFTWANGKFDCRTLFYSCGIKARVDEDTMLKHFVQISEKKGCQGLKYLAPIFVQAPQWDDELDAFKKEYCRKHKILLKNFTYNLIPTKTLLPYMCLDCIATRRLLGVFEELKEPGTDWIYRQLIRASNIFTQIELTGAYADAPYLKELEASLSKEREEAAQEVRKSIAYFWNPAKYSHDTGAKFIAEFNLKSPKQLRWLLTQALGFDPETTDADMMDSLATQIENGDLKVDEHAKELFRNILALRKADKYLDTYVYGIQDVTCRDGRVRGNYNLHGTETGRLSSSGPNMQNIPRNKRIKNIFCATYGYNFIQLDQSQAELRVMAYHTKDEHLVETYRQGKDLHSEMAEAIFGPDYTDENRSVCKTLNFGIPYGRGAAAISESKDFRGLITKQQAQQTVDSWLRVNHGAKKWMDEKRREAARGVRQQTIFGRVRHYVLNDENGYHIGNNYINTPIQADASDLTLFALMDFYDWLVEKGYYIPWNPDESRVRIVITVHDSIVIECVSALVEEVAYNAKRIMEAVPPRLLPGLDFPFRADCEVGVAWGKVRKVDFESTGKMVFKG